MKTSHTRYYVHGCNYLFDSIMEVVESAASAEWNDKTPYEWLIEMDIDISDTNILWTEAIRYYLRKTVRVYNRRDHDYLKDLPF